MQARDRVEVFSSFLHSFTLIDAEACIGFMSDDIKYITPCVPPPIARYAQGRDQVGEMFRTFFTRVAREYAFEELQFYAITDDPQLVAARGRINVVLRNSGHYRNECAYIGRIVNAGVSEFFEFFDTTRAAQALAGTA
jgi:ketosteroid isomerase-like protein